MKSVTSPVPFIKVFSFCNVESGAGEAVVKYIKIFKKTDNLRG